MFLKQYHAGLEEVIHIVTMGPGPSAFPTIESFKIVPTCLSLRKVEVDLKTTSLCRVIDSFQLNN